MTWLHAGWQAVAFFVGLAALYEGLIRYIARTRERPVLAGAFRRRRHIVLGAVYAAMVAVGYGLGCLAVYRTRGADALLGSRHALLGTILIMFAAIVSLLGTSLAGREEERLERLHRLFGFALSLLFVLQIALGVGLLVR